jgi:dTDP-4-dehydrorhamnose 3,5-epimerase-like enzyme
MFVPAGVANAYQTTDPNTQYLYHVDGYWRPGEQYPGVNVADPALGVRWPVPLAEAVLSGRDRDLPPLAELRR